MIFLYICIASTLLASLWLENVGLCHVECKGMFADSENLGNIQHKIQFSANVCYLASVSSEWVCESCTA